MGYIDGALSRSKVHGESETAIKSSVDKALNPALTLALDPMNQLRLVFIAVYMRSRGSSWVSTPLRRFAGLPYVS